MAQEATRTRGRRRAGDGIERAVSRTARGLPILGGVAILLGLISVAIEVSPVQPAEIPERILRILLFLLSAFVGAYSPVPGQPATPSILSTIVLILALLTSLGAVALAVVGTMAKRIDLERRLRRADRVLVVGDLARINRFANALEASAITAVTASSEPHAMVTLVDPTDAAATGFVRRAMRGGTTACVFSSSTVEGALLASSLRQLSPQSRVFQLFDWTTDRLTFRGPITDGRIPRLEAFSPDEIVANAILRTIIHVTRLAGTVRVHADGDSVILPILCERMKAMQSVVGFLGEVVWTSDPADADVVVLDVEQRDYLSSIEATRSPHCLVITIAPEKYFAAVDREDLQTIPMRDWLRTRDEQGALAWRGRVVVVDRDVVGYDVDEVRSGLETQWARIFHNAHSDFGREDPHSNPNRWLDAPLHPRLETMSRAAVNLMLRDLHERGYDLAVREGDHDALSAEDVESCARHVHEQYLALTWTDAAGAVHRCADYFVTSAGAAVPTAPPPPWEEDSEDARERNRAMIREVYPALAAAFGYRITTRRSAAAPQNRARERSA